MTHIDELAQPDGFIGAILAAEGLTDGCTILNGPTGCKMHLGELCKDQFRRENDTDILRWAEEFFFRQDRLPCTYIDDYDYVFGTAEKLEYVFPRVAEKGYAFITVLNSPGASLIGDDLQRYLEWSGLAIPTTVLESPFYSAPMEEGWCDAACRIIEQLAPGEHTPQALVVNLLGISLWQHHWQGSCAELTRLLNLCGIEVHAALFAGSTVEQLRNLRRASCNVIIQEELGRPLAEFLKQRYAMPFVGATTGAPLGFDAVEEWISEVCRAVGADPAPALAESRHHRQKAAEKLYRFTAKTGLPRGAGFALALEPSLAYPFTKWLVAYLGMTPLAINVTDPNHPLAHALQNYLIAIGAPQAMHTELSSTHRYDIVFANDAVILRLMENDRSLAGIDLAMPSKSLTYFFPRAILGLTGTLWILEQICTNLWPKGSEGGP